MNLKFIAQVLVYEEGDCLERAIVPWTKVCERIDIFEGAFQTTINLGYPPRSQDETMEVAKTLVKANPNVTLTHHNEWNEPILRNNHLFNTIKEFGRDNTVLFILDGDEIYSQEEVDFCIAQVQSEINNFNTFWVSMKNYINDEKTYYKGFRVPRFFRLKTARGFSGYNDIQFDEGVISTDIRHVEPKHMSWTPMDKARRKLRWQTESLSWLTSFVEKDGQLILNEQYYQQTGKAKPIFIKE